MPLPLVYMCEACTRRLLLPVVYARGEATPNSRTCIWSGRQRHSIDEVRYGHTRKCIVFIDVPWVYLAAMSETNLILPCRTRAKCKLFVGQLGQFELSSSQNKIKLYYAEYIELNVAIRFFSKVV